MDAVVRRLRARLIPAILTALGVVLLGGGLLSYTGPVEAGPEPSQPPVATAGPTPGPTAGPSSTPGPTAGPSGEPSAVPSPTVPPDRVATRVIVAALGIDLPVIRQPDPAYPACDVAMYHEALGQPGSNRATYLYAHAREGMFLPILDASKIDDGASMLGLIAEVYTSDDQLFLYEIIEVRRHQVDLDDAAAATTEQLWLQTSEGPRGTAGKTQVVARFLSTGSADHEVAHPIAQPRDCG
ncbi:MAG TPA: hypothetical protein VLS28_11160 [Candidatus Sulfomarinibacteraceae bacterium]|nr:hypothetical protein [Candidatus Sulfomarinibacteraceae bacterium]